MDSTQLSASVYRQRLYADYGEHVAWQSGRTADSFGAREPYLNRLVRDHFPANRNARVLDLGCGHGALLRSAMNRGYRHLEGVDCSAAQVEVARGVGLSSVRKADLFETLEAAPAESYDVIVAFDVLEHLTKEEGLVFADLCRERLAPRGRWIVHVPNGNAPFVGSVLFGDCTHHTAYTERSIVQLMRVAGFSVVDCFEDTPVVHGARSAVRRLCWSGLRTVLRFYLAVETGAAPRHLIFSQNLLAVAHR